MAIDLATEAVFCIPSKGFDRDDLRKLRLSLGMTQKEFALEFNFSVSTVIAWENALRKPSADNVFELQKIKKSVPVVVEIA